MSTDTSGAILLLEKWLEEQLSSDALTWYRERREDLETERTFYLTFALVPRKLGKADLQLAAGAHREAEVVCPGWDVRRWTVDQAARIALLLASPEGTLTERLEKLCATGDVGELVTLYQALPLYPHPEKRTARAAEGLRSNVVPVFEAVAHRNPFPERYFDEAAWNQMVLKALFIGSSLHPIRGLEARANESLAKTLFDYVHERWAAGRAVNPELWRCVGPFLNAERLEDVRRAWASEERLSRAAARLALSASDLPEAQTLLHSEAEDPTLFSWEDIHRALSTC